MKNADLFDIFDLFMPIEIFQNKNLSFFMKIQNNDTIIFGFILQSDI